MSATILPFRKKQSPGAITAKSAYHSERDRAALLVHFRDAVIAADEAGLDRMKEEYLRMFDRVCEQARVEAAEPEFNRIAQQLGGLTMEEHDAIACRRRFEWTWEECRNSILTRRHYGEGSGGAA